MASMRYVSVGVLLLLGSLFGCASASHNQIEFRAEMNNISFQNTITFDNYTSITDPQGTNLRTLSNGTAWDYKVPKNTTNILTA
jgi:hypothetical protein